MLMICQVMSAFPQRVYCGCMVEMWYWRCVILEAEFGECRIGPRKRVVPQAILGHKQFEVDSFNTKVTAIAQLCLKIEFTDPY
jgi:hypothetical protein